MTRAAQDLLRAVQRHSLALAAAGVVLVVYGPAVRADYGKLDDYTFLWASNSAPEWITGHDRQLGRFLAAVLHRWAFESITTISEIRYVRGLTVVALAGFAAGFAGLLRSRGWPPAIGAALAVLVCTTPSAQSTVGFATSVHRPFAALCALLASSAAARAANRCSMRQHAVWLLAATGALVGALFFQQSWAMFYVTCCFVRSFHADRNSPQPGRFRLLAVQAAVLALSLAIAVAALRCAAEPTERSSLTRDGLGKLVWFVSEPLVNAGSLFQITPSHATVALVGATIATGGVAFLVRRNAFGARCLLWGVVLLPLAYLPNLLTAESWASYRSIGPLSALVLVLVAWAAWGIASASCRSPHVPASALATGLAAWSCMAARTNVVDHIIAMQVAERELFRAQLLNAEGLEVTAIHVVQPRWEYWPSRVCRYEDFGVPSSFAPWCPEPMRLSQNLDTCGVRRIGHVDTDG